MKHLEGVQKDGLKRLVGRRAFRLVRVLQTRFCAFNDLVGERVPEVVVEVLGGEMERERIQMFLHSRLYLGELREMFLVGGGELHGLRHRGGPVLLHEPRGLPFLRRDGPIATHPLFIKFHIISRRSADKEGHTQRVGSVLLDEHQRINAVAEGFTELSTLFIAYNAMEKYGAEGDVAEVISRHKDHAGDPEKEYFVSRGDNRSRMVGFEVNRALRPAERRECPETGREPGIQGVRVLLKKVRAAGAGFAQVYLNSLSILDGVNGEHLPLIKVFHSFDQRS